MLNKIFKEELVLIIFLDKKIEVKGKN